MTFAQKSSAATPRAMCCSIPQAFCWKARLRCQTCIILSSETGFSSSPLQLALWHSSCLLTGLLDFSVSCSVICVLHRNNLLFSSKPLLFPSPYYGAAGLDSGGITCVAEIVPLLPDTLEHIAVLPGSYSMVLYKKVHRGKIKAPKEVA